MRSTVLISLLLALLTAAVYFEVGGHGFVDFDDFVYVHENPLLEDTLTARGLVRAFVEPYEANWIPLTWISLQLNRAVHGLEPAGYHLTNLALHLLSTLLLFLALWRMTGARWPSAFVAAVFAVHPLHVQSVAWVTERKDVLSGLFWMLGLYGYAAFVERPTPARYGAVLLAFTAGLLSKSSVVSLPFALLLLDYWPLGRMAPASGKPRLDPGRLAGLVLEKLPMVVLAAMVSGITFALQGGSGAVRTGDIPFYLRLANAADSYVAYLADAFWPRDLAAFYPHPLDSLATGMALLEGIGLLLLTAVFLRAAARRPHLIVGWLWFLGTLVPMIGLVQVGLQARADRYMYLALIGLAIMVAWSARELVSRDSRARIPAAAAGITAVGVLAVVAFGQVRTWRDTTTLFEHALAVTQGNFVAHHRLGVSYRQQGQLDRAESHYREALRLVPAWPSAQLEYASLLQESGDVDGAIEAFRAGLAHAPDHGTAHQLLGILLVQRERYDEAEPHLREAVELGVAEGETLAALAILAERKGDVEKATSLYRAALERSPDLVSASNNLAWILATHAEASVRDPAEAVQVAEASVELTRGQQPALLDTLAAAYAAAGRYEDAVRTQARAMRLAGTDAALLAAFRDRLRLYQAGQPYHQSETRELPQASPRGGLQGAVVILLDTVRADHLSVYGYERQTSPSLERLATRASVFDAAISNAPWTLPAVAGLLAGGTGSADFDAPNRRLKRSIVDAFLQEGFSTAAFTEGGFVSRQFGLDRSFTRWLETEGAVRYNEESERAPADGGEAVETIAATFGESRAWLDANAGRPFFLLIHTYESHVPYQRHTFSDGLARGRIGPSFTSADALALQRGGEYLEAEELEYLTALYDGGIREADHHVGEFLDHLQRIGLADRTLVVVTSDHGEELGEHYPAHAGDHGHSLHDSLVRVPLIIADPRLPARRVAAQVRTLDILPTIAARLGVVVPSWAQGRDLSQLMRGESMPELPARGGSTKVGPDRAFVRQDGFKYIARRATTGQRPMAAPPPEAQLYDLSADPGEQRNLAGLQREEEVRLAAELGGMSAGGADPVDATLEGLPRELGERLRSLGYTE